MHPRPRPSSDTNVGHSHNPQDRSMASPALASRFPPAFAGSDGPHGQPPSPVRLATSCNAFGLGSQPGPSTLPSPRDTARCGGSGSAAAPFDQMLNSVGSPSRTRRTSMQSLALKPSQASRGQDPCPRYSNPHSLQDPPSSNTPVQRTLSANPFAQPLPAWPSRTDGPFLANALVRRTLSAPALELKGLGSNTPETMETTLSKLEQGAAARRDRDGGESSGGEQDEDRMLDSRPRLRWGSSEIRSSSISRHGKARMGEADPEAPHVPPFSGRPLPAPLLATLISESAPLEHEMRSEARLQRLLSSHASVFPLTPRAPRSSRGRFPETAGDDEDDDGSGSRSGGRWMNRAGSSDSDSSDGMPVEDPTPDYVNSAFAAVMDMDRATSDAVHVPNGSQSSSVNGTAGQPTPPNQHTWPRDSGSASRMSFGSAGAGFVTTPGTGIALPNAFGGLGMGGGLTPQASPTAERLELLATSPSLSVASPGMMQYRDSNAASVRPGKRKAGQEDRFDPYKRPRGTSPSLLASSPGLALSPSRTSAIPIPQSPGHAPLFSSNLSNTNGNGRVTRPGGHLYSRPLGSRSRAASPALSIGSTSGVLSTSLGNNCHTPGTRPSVSLGQAFIPTGAGPAILAQAQGQQPQGLGGLGLLSLNQQDKANVGDMEQD